MAGSLYTRVFSTGKKPNQTKQNKTWELMLLRESLAVSSISFVHWLNWQCCWGNLQAANRSPTQGLPFFLLCL